MSIETHIRCPSCQGPLVTTQLRCDPCDLSLSGRFPTNEFASLGEDDLHFLRIFILTEGRIREMESALGVSYPTIKSRLSQLKSTLAKSPNTTDAPTTTSHFSLLTSSDSILKDLEAGRITFEQAAAQLKTRKE